MIPQWIIEKKRDGGELLPAEIREFIAAYTAGEIPDYQMSALAMAVYFKGMAGAETAALTEAMLLSGASLNWSHLPCPTADKHSTGGIGDKISLILAPLAAAAGVAVPMISGRGLGITGGTLDKLEAIKGFNVNLSLDRFREIVREVGCCMIGQTAQIAPADSKLYALRDVTGTVPSIPLITASIMSKKLAEGAKTLVFDVKFGRGAFMKTRKDAEMLAESMKTVGESFGRNIRYILTEMDSPHGRTIGNALEVREALEVLGGGGPKDVRELTIKLTSLMFAEAETPDLASILDSGAALKKFEEMSAAQGADAFELGEAPYKVECLSPQTGTISDIDAEALGKVALILGAGRTKVVDKVDHTVGLSEILQRGEHVAAGSPLLLIHARSSSDAQSVMALCKNAFQFC